MDTQNIMHLGVYGIIENDGKILLVKKSRGPYEGMWDLPGGGPAHGETISETLLREVFEETGLHVLHATHFVNKAFLVEYMDGVKHYSLHHTCIILRVTKYDSTEYCATINVEDTNGCAWFEKSELDSLSLSKVVKCALYS